MEERMKGVGSREGRCAFVSRAKCSRAMFAAQTPTAQPTCKQRHERMYLHWLPGPRAPNPACADTRTRAAKAHEKNNNTKRTSPKQHRITSHHPSTSPLIWDSAATPQDLCMNTTAAHELIPPTSSARDMAYDTSANAGWPRSAGGHALCHADSSLTAGLSPASAARHVADRGGSPRACARWMLTAVMMAGRRSWGVRCEAPAASCRLWCRRDAETSRRPEDRAAWAQARASWDCSTQAAGQMVGM